MNYDLLTSCICHFFPTIGIGETTQKELTTVASCINLISESTGSGLHDLYQVMKHLAVFIEFQGVATFNDKMKVL